MKVLSVVVMLLMDLELKLDSRSGERVLSRKTRCRLKPFTMELMIATVARTGIKAIVAMIAGCRWISFISNTVTTICASRLCR